MSLMSTNQIKRMQWIKKVLGSPDSVVKPAELPALTKELEKLRFQFQDEEQYLGLDAPSKPD